MNIAMEVGKRANCMKRKVGTVIVKDKRVITTGYNGTPRGLPNCDEHGCKRCNSFGVTGEDLGECICSHAEENAIIQGAYHGVSVKNCTLYTTLTPCTFCAKLIINSGIIEVVYNNKYPLDKGASTLLRKAGVKVRGM
jgi:dCMP deaminase